MREFVHSGAEYPLLESALPLPPRAVDVHAPEIAQTVFGKLAPDASGHMHMRTLATVLSLPSAEQRAPHNFAYALTHSEAASFRVPLTRELGVALLDAHLEESGGKNDFWRQLGGGGTRSIAPPQFTTGLSMVEEALRLVKLSNAPDFKPNPEWTSSVHSLLAACIQWKGARENPVPLLTDRLRMYVDNMNLRRPPPDGPRVAPLAILIFFCEVAWKYITGEKSSVRNLARALLTLFSDDIPERVGVEEGKYNFADRASLIEIVRGTVLASAGPQPPVQTGSDGASLSELFAGEDTADGTITLSRATVASLLQSGYLAPSGIWFRGQKKDWVLAYNSKNYATLGPNNGAELALYITQKAGDVDVKIKQQAALKLYEAMKDHKKWDKFYNNAIFSGDAGRAARGNFKTAVQATGTEFHDTLLS